MRPTLIRFCIYGLLGWCREVVWTAVTEKAWGNTDCWRRSVSLSTTYCGLNSGCGGVLRIWSVSGESSMQRAGS